MTTTPAPQSGHGDTDTLARELRSLFGAYRRRLWEHSDTADLTPSQISAILRLEEKGQATVSDLARAEGMRPQSMGAIIAALETVGMITHQPDPQDGRKMLLSLTPKCQDWLTLGRAQRMDWLLRRIEDRLRPEEQKKVLAALPLLHRLMET
ncbi:MarR family transcriptional regulator [Rhodobacter sp. TJ_12]|uniref:MarR family winged helix-turn-helix transcriptional regulator n=1 Tax=Rhodobacter sp. TJ_12 TaxID=2029399 RepID=UPI001CC13D71|nr:MarR family transcriptional regulator [Rhodobacter sp. TJ_12]MBZ4021294.1 MarR family transcriptional regulator [Rhodobacter sp. TJ_12]